jgi:hypothetical protein
VSKTRKLLVGACVAAVAAPAAVAAVPEATAAPSPRLPNPDLGEHGGLSAEMEADQAARQRAQRRREAGEIASFPAILHRIARCESGGNPRAIGGGGLYRGAFQFSQSTWNGVGGKGDPIDAPLVEQYRRAALLLKRSGPGQWPACAG